MAAKSLKLEAMALCPSACHRLREVRCGELQSRRKWVPSSIVSVVMTREGDEDNLATNASSPSGTSALQKGLRAWGRHQRAIRWMSFRSPIWEREGTCFMEAGGLSPEEGEACDNGNKASNDETSGDDRL